MHCKMLSSVLSLHSLDANSTAPHTTTAQLWQPQTPADNVKIPQGRESGKWGYGAKGVETTKSPS